MIINNLKSSRNQIKEEKEKRRNKRAKKESLKAEKAAELEKQQENVSDEEDVEKEKMTDDQILDKEYQTVRFSTVLTSRDLDWIGFMIQLCRRERRKSCPHISCC